MSHKCDCGKGAKWWYMPNSDMDNPFCCEDCVPRSCTCNYRSEDSLHVTDGIEGIDWKWVENTNPRQWTSIDDKGREWPCAEWEWDDDEDNFNDY